MAYYKLDDVIALTMIRIEIVHVQCMESAFICCLYATVIR